MNVPVVDVAVTEPRRPPRLIVKALTVAFGTVAALLGVLFVVVTFSVRNQVRQTVASNLESTQRLFAAVETRRQHELRGQAETLADNATLKAALDTYQSETQANRADGPSPICWRRSTSCSRGWLQESSPTRSCSWTAATSPSRRLDAWRTAGREAGRCRSSPRRRPGAWPRSMAWRTSATRCFEW